MTGVVGAGVCCAFLFRFAWVGGPAGGRAEGASGLRVRGALVGTWDPPGFLASFCVHGGLSLVNF